MACMESMLPKGIPRSGTPSRGIDKGYMVHDYQLTMRAIGRGLQPLQRCGHYPFALLAEKAEHTDGGVSFWKRKTQSCV